MPRPPRREETPPTARPVRRRAAFRFRPELTALEERVVPATATEVEVNNTAATANAVSIASGDVLTTAPDNWLTVSGSIASSSDVDFYKFTIGSRSGVFLDTDSFETGLSGTLDTVVTVFNSTGATQLGSNDEGYDFDTGFSAPNTQIGFGEVRDSALYLDLAAGTYLVRVSPFTGTGNYQLRLLADPNYTSTVPVFTSLAGAADTLFLDFNGHTSAGDDWRAAGYTMTPYDFSGNATEFSPGERLAIRNTWATVAEDFSPYNLNVTTVQPTSFSDGSSFRMVYTNSSPAVINQPTGILGIAFVGSYAGFGVGNQLAFVFANNFPTFSFSNDNPASGQVVAKPLEMGNTTAHEFGHALSLQHYVSNPPGQATVMFTPDQGLSRELWGAGGNENGASQNDMVLIAGAANTIGFRPDDHGNSRAAATALGAPLTAQGVISDLTVPDSDFFSFAAAGATTVTVDVNNFTANLDAELRVFDANGVLLGTADPSPSPDASLSFANLTAGTYFAQVSSDNNPAGGEAGQYTLRVVTSPPPSNVRINISDASQTEGNAGTANMIFTVSLSAASAQTVTVAFSTADQTASGGLTGDYQPTSGTLTFTPGQTTRTLTVLIPGNTVAEPTETFAVNLSNPANASIADGKGVGTILDNDTVNPAITVNNVTVTEGNSGTRTATFTVRLSGGANQSVAVDFATADGTAAAPADYQATSGRLTFLPGQTAREVRVTVAGDVAGEPNETFFVRLSNAVNGTITDGEGLGTITNDDAGIPHLALHVSSFNTDNDPHYHVPGFPPLGAAFTSVFAAGGGLDGPTGVQQGPDLTGDAVGELFIASSRTNSVLAYDGRSGALVRTFVAAGSGGLRDPRDITFGPDGHLYVSSFATHQVLRYDGATGAFRGVAAASERLRGPTGLAFGADGLLYVANSLRDEVVRYDSATGRFHSGFAATNPGGLDDPQDITFGPDGHLLVSSFGTDRVLRYDGRTGRLLGTFAGGGGLDGPVGLAYGPDGHLYVSSALTNSVLRYHGTTGAFRDVFVPPGVGGVSRPTYLTFANSWEELPFVPSEGSVAAWRTAGSRRPAPPQPGGAPADSSRSLTGASTLPAGVNASAGGSGGGRTRGASQAR